MRCGDDRGAHHGRDPVRGGAVVPVALALGTAARGLPARGGRLRAGRIRVDHRHLHVRFFPLLRKSIPLEEIARWEARTYRPILEYGGSGLRYSWKGRAYNVSGNRGVQLEMADGKRVL
jgi:hypothetical protein